MAASGGGVGMARDGTAAGSGDAGTGRAGGEIAGGVDLGAGASGSRATGQAVMEDAATGNAGYGSPEASRRVTTNDGDTNRHDGRTGGSPGTNGGAGASAVPSATVAAEPWPGEDEVSTIDEQNTFGANMSGLFYEPASADEAATLWAVQNNPPKLYKLTQTDEGWASAPSWGGGKQLYWPGKKGKPDTEDVTRAEYSSPAVYVCTERDSEGEARLSVLRFDTTAKDTALGATHEWNLTTAIQSSGSTNGGLEALAWVPDSVLTERGFLDEGKGRPYAPDDYPQKHGTGVFFVGHEMTGKVFGFVLDETGGTYHQVASFASGLTKKQDAKAEEVMALWFDRESNRLWAACDDNCGGDMTVFDIDTTFRLRRKFHGPPDISNMNNEGFTFASETTCENGLKSVFWSDDSATNGYALRSGRMRCGEL